MTRNEAVNEALKHLQDAPVPVEDKRPFLIRLLESVRIKITPNKNPAASKVEITGGTDF
jgi:hypothetical protein